MPCPKNIVIHPCPSVIIVFFSLSLSTYSSTYVYVCMNECMYIDIFLTQTLKPKPYTALSSYEGPLLKRSPRRLEAMGPPPGLKAGQLLCRSGRFFA